MVLTQTLAAVSLMLAAAPEKAAFPTYFTVYDRAAFSRTTLQCSPVDRHPERLSCDFTVLEISMPTPESWKKAVAIAEADLAGLDKEWEREETRVNATTLFKESCPRLEDNRIDLERQRAAFAPYAHGADFRLELAAKVSTELAAICACAEPLCVRDHIKASLALKLEQEKRSPECELDTTHWTGTFEKKGSSWTRKNLTPTDLCFASETQSVEPRDDRPNRRWTFRTVRVPKPGSEAKAFCKGRPVESSSSAENFPPFVLQCRVKL